MGPPLWQINNDGSQARRDVWAKLDRLSRRPDRDSWPTEWVALDAVYGHDPGGRDWFGFGTPPVLLVGISEADVLLVPCRAELTYTAPDAVVDSVVLSSVGLHSGLLRQTLADLAGTARAYRTWCVQCGRFDVASTTTGWCGPCDLTRRGIVA